MMKHFCESISCTTWFVISCSSKMTWPIHSPCKAFLGELYVYLVDEMHIGLGQTLAVEDQRPVPAPLTDTTQLKHFAREAEVNNNFDTAARCYQEVRLDPCTSLVFICNLPCADNNINTNNFLFLFAKTWPVTCWCYQQVILTATDNDSSW